MPGPSGGLLTLYLVAVSLPAQAAAQARRSALALSDTMGSFRFMDPPASVDRPITVWYYRPGKHDPDARIVFVMHGSSRTAEMARDSGAVFGRRHGYIVLAPEFSELDYPGDGYAFGHMIDSAGRLQPKSQWALSVIDRVFDKVRLTERLASSTYDIVGHSAGGQFVHRLVLFIPDARFRRAVASSPGRYAVPSLTTPFPYGLRGTPIDSANLLHTLSRDFVLVLGDRDTEDRPRETEAMQQGRNRFARGLRFFAVATETAAGLGASLGWRLVVVRGADHSPGPMVRAGLQELLR